jgi:hypothetical protein
MSVHLQQIRFFATTKDQPEAGTDSGVEFWFYVNDHSLTTFPTSGWNRQVLDHPWDDREKGRTELYEIDFKAGDTAISLSGTTVPRGIAFNDFTHARTASFTLRMRGDDWWRIDHYYLLGHFKELRHVPGTIDSFETINHGWLLMSRRDADVDMSTDPTEGMAWHFIDLNGTF